MCWSTADNAIARNGKAPRAGVAPHSFFEVTRLVTICEHTEGWGAQGDVSSSRVEVVSSRAHTTTAATEPTRLPRLIPPERCHMHTVHTCAQCAQCARAMHAPRTRHARATHAPHTREALTLTKRLRSTPPDALSSVARSHSSKSKGSSEESLHRSLDTCKGKPTRACACACTYP